MRVCFYPECGHREVSARKSTAGAVCKMHIFPADPQACRKWLQACNYQYSPIKLPAHVYLCSCHFVGGHGPTHENHEPIPYVPSETSQTVCAQKKFRPNVLTLPAVDKLEISNNVLDKTETDHSYSHKMSVDIIHPETQDLSQEFDGTSSSHLSVPTTSREFEDSFSSNDSTPTCANGPGGPKEDYGDLAVPLKSPVNMETYPPGNHAGYTLKRTWRSRGKVTSKRKERLDTPRHHRDNETQCNLPAFSYEKSKMYWSNSEFEYMTGISRTAFEILYKFLGGDKVCSKLKYRYDAKTPVRRKDSTHSTKGKLFITLVRLRRGYTLKEMSLMFNLRKSTIGAIFFTWIRLMAIKFKSLEEVMFVSAADQQENKPDCYKPFPNLRCVVDSTEVKIQMSANMEQQSNTFSPYKGCNSAKFLVVTSVYGGLSFISEGFVGSISDRKLFLRSGIMKYLEPGDAVMVDRGFDIEADLNDIDVELIIPPFLRGREAFTARELMLAKAIASSRIHVET